MDILVLFTQPEAWLSLITLSIMEIVLGIDNVIFISLVTSKLKPEQQNKARRIGLFLALFIRVILLSFISYIVNEMVDPIVSFLDFNFSWRDIILLAGGIFLLYKSTIEIYELLEVDAEEKSKRVNPTFWNVVMQVILIDIVFSFDSIITAVGLAKDLPIMIMAVIISMIIMLFFSGAISKFIDMHPSIKLLALAFLLTIGMLLVAEGFGQHISKGYVYFAMAFSVLVEILNMRMRKKKNNPVELKDLYK
ncbi:MAG: TerC family protein [Bacteroidia bacterium]|jgi:predicted tellurium resistance membrane protein TerC|nr:TerC family protein [Bacteroidia bacterium]